jgi:hypothetical protein
MVAAGIITAGMVLLDDNHSWLSQHTKHNVRSERPRKAGPHERQFDEHELGRQLHLGLLYRKRATTICRCLSRFLGDKWFPKRESNRIVIHV